MPTGDLAALAEEIEIDLVRERRDRARQKSS
jgi:hypothetical protein